MKKVIITFLVLIIFSFWVNAGTINIPDDYSSIQAGLNVADSSDTVLVQPGTYYENIFWPETNGIKLISAGDSSNTIIDGGENSSVIYINPISSNIDSTTLIKGFKITNGGNVANGGGIFISSSSSPILKLLNISGNTAGDKGGGIYVYGGSPIITNCKIANNSITSNNSSRWGGGIYFNECNGTIQNSVIEGNSGAVLGGGVSVLRENPILKELIVKNNIAERGGGIYLGLSNSYLFDVLVENNTATDATFGGGGVNLFGGSDTLINIISKNNRAGNGAGLNLGSSSCIMINILSINNVSTGRGGGLALSPGCNIKNLKVVDNEAIYGGGIVVYGTNQEVENKIRDISIISNKAKYGGAVWFGENNATNQYAKFENLTLFENHSEKGNNGFYIRDGKPEIFQTNFINNGTAIYNADNSNILEATDNWFGHSSGPYHPNQNSSGQGDSVNAFVNVTPWLTEPDTAAPPIPVQNLHISSIGNDFIELSWDKSPLGDLSGYKICYKTDTTEFFYTDTIDVGNVTSYSLAGLSAGSTYYIAAICYDTDGNESWYSTKVCASIPVVGIHPDSRGLPSEYSLSQNYPNPFNTTTTISFQLPKSLFVKLSIFDINGRLVEMLVNEYKNVGYYSVEWNAKNVGSGIYFYRINVSDFSEVKKCLVVK